MHAELVVFVFLGAVVVFPEGFHMLAGISDSWQDCLSAGFLKVYLPRRLVLRSI